MKRAKAPKPAALPPAEQPSLFGEARETLGLPLFSGAPVPARLDTFNPPAVDPKPRQLAIIDPSQFEF